MSDAVLIALIGAVPATIGAYATLVEAVAKRRDLEEQRHRHAVEEPVAANAAVPTPPPAPTSGSAPVATDEITHPPPRSPLRLVILVVATLTVTVAAMLGAAVLLHDRSDEHGPVDEHVDVPGDRPWTDTGIEVESGELVRVHATGEVFHSVEKNLKSGPDGVPDSADYPTNIIKGVPHNSLIGRIDKGDAFPIGAQSEFAAPASGRLQLRTNDAGIENNRGSYDARVEIPNRPTK